MRVVLSDESRKTLELFLHFGEKKKRFRSLSNRVSFPPSEKRKLSADIKSKKNCPWGS